MTLGLSFAETVNTVIQSRTKNEKACLGLACRDMNNKKLGMHRRTLPIDRSYPFWLAGFSTVTDSTQDQRVARYPCEMEMRGSLHDYKAGFTGGVHCPSVSNSQRLRHLLNKLQCCLLNFRFCPMPLAVIARNSKGIECSARADTNPEPTESNSRITLFPLLSVVSGLGQRQGFYARRFVEVQDRRRIPMGFLFLM